MTDVKIIEINNGYEDRFFIEQDLTNTKKFFNPVYKRSAELIDEICSFGKTIGKQKPKSFFDEYYPNNIIVYCAERGGGKTTAMLSVASALNQLTDPDNEKYSAEIRNYFSASTQTCKFSVLAPIDPTTISADESFMRIILSRMFSALRLFWEKNDNGEKTSDTRNTMYARSEIVEGFSECYKLLDVIYKCKTVNSDNDLEELTDLGDFSRLKNKFMNLVDNYLKHIFCKSENGYLVILIDDADLNTQKSFEIIEDIRKYCILPNVIVLMAANMGQMNQIIEQHYLGEFDKLLNFYSKNDDPDAIDTRITKEMTVKYINKVFPSTHQIHLPVIADFIRNSSSSLELKYIKSGDPDPNANGDRLKYAANDYQERLLNLVHQKTGIAFVKPNHYLHNFLPGNMRDLTHFLSYFCALTDIDHEYGGYANLYSAILNSKEGSPELQGAYDEIKKRSSNLEALQVYFLTNWCDRNLCRKNCKIITDLAETVETLMINSALNTVNDIIEERNIQDEDHRALNGRIIMFCDSYGELMRRISLVSRNARTQNDFLQTYKLVFALRLIFTIFLHKEMLKGIMNKSFEWLYKITGGVLWQLNYKRISPNYPFGRFELNYPIYQKLFPDVSDIELKPLSLKNKSTDKDLIRYCYLIKNGETKKIDQKIATELRTKKNGKANDITIVFDAAAYLLDFLTDQRNYLANDKQSLNSYNYLFEILTNWEVFHKVEKRAEEVQINELTDFDPVSWHKRLMSLICSDDLELDYLNIGIIENVPDDVERRIFFTNRDMIEVMVKNAIDKMKEISGSGIAHDRLLTTSIVLQFIRFTLPELDRYTERYIRPLKIIVAKNSVVNKIDQMISDMKEKFSEIRQSSPKRYAELVNSMNDTLQNNWEEYILTINDWIQEISSDNLFEQIMKDVDKAFGTSKTDKKKPKGTVTQGEQSETQNGAPDTNNKR